MGIRKKWKILLCGPLLVWIISVFVVYFTRTQMSVFSSETIRGHLISQTVGYNWSSEKTGNNSRDSTDITLITAYFNIGAFPKGSRANIRSPTKYTTWLLAYQYIHNPIIAFFEKGDINGLKFQEIRKTLDVPTKLIWLNRSDLWSFRIISEVEKIFKKPGYPKFLPNTVVPEYACVSLAKFELVKKVIDEKLANTRYVAWVDAGYWRWKIPKYTKLILPPDFEHNKVTFNMVFKRNPELDYKYIISHNTNWINGGLFLAKQAVMLDLVDSYIKNVKYFISLGYFAAEQQLIYSMANTVSVPAKLPTIQTYSHPGFNVSTCPDVWMYIGCLCWQHYDKMLNS